MIRPLVVSLVLTLAMPLAASAQAAPPPAAGAPGMAAPAPQQHHHHAHYLKALRSLALTPDQHQQIEGFVRATKAANAGVDRMTRHANAKHLRREIEAVLTPDQRAQLHATLVQERSHVPQR